MRPLYCLHNTNGHKQFHQQTKMMSLESDQLSLASTSNSMSDTSDAAAPVQKPSTKTHPSTTITAQLQSPLLRLPAELRNEIFSCTLSGLIVYLNHNDTISYHTPERHEDLDGVSRNELLKNTPNCLSLLKTCRQIYSEAAHLPFKHYAYFYGSYGYGSKLGRLNSNQIAAIKRIKLTYHWDCPRNPCRECLFDDLDAIALLPFVESIQIVVADHHAEDRAGSAASSMMTQEQVNQWVHSEVVGFLDWVVGPPNSADVTISSEVVVCKCKALEERDTNVSGP